MRLGDSLVVTLTYGVFFVSRTIGALVGGPTTRRVVDSIVEAEKQGIPAVWMTSGGGLGCG